MDGRDEISNTDIVENMLDTFENIPYKFGEYVIFDSPLGEKVCKIYMIIPYNDGNFWYMLEEKDNVLQAEGNKIVRLATSEEIFLYIMEVENTP